MGNMPFQRKDSDNGLTEYQAAAPSIPEPLRSALYRSLAKARLTENDPLWWFHVGQAELLKAFLDDWRGRQDLEIRELAKSVQYVKDPETRPENVWRRWAWRVIIGGLILLLGFVLGRLYDSREANARVDAANARVDAVISAFPAAARVPLFLYSRGGSITRGPINPAPGHNEKEGIVISKGDLAEPWISADGQAAVIPIP